MKESNNTEAYKMVQKEKIFSELIFLERAHPLKPTRWREGCRPLSCRRKHLTEEIRSFLPQSWLEGDREDGVETNQLRGSRAGRGQG